jgi:peptidoglycan/xylan/chitin deacetylase (PgdA/CDA1 family)/predicted ATP-grasp superfamily ATP-dependent carboligase
MPNAALGSEYALTPELFEQQLIWLKRHFHVLALTEAFAAATAGNLPRNSVVITIDDGFYDCFEYIFPLLIKHGLKATFFISTSGIELGYLWENQISDAIDNAQIGLTSVTLAGQDFDIQTRDQKLHSIAKITELIKYQTIQQRKVLIDLLLTQLQSKPQPHQFLTEQQIRTMHENGMTIGAHTVHHPILALEEADNARKEIEESKLRLENIIGTSVDYFAYPNGKFQRDFNADHIEMVRQLGFKAAFCTEWGVATPDKDCLFQLKRFTPWDKNPAKFCLRLALNTLAERNIFKLFQNKVRQQINLPVTQIPNQYAGKRVKQNLANLKQAILVPQADSMGAIAVIRSLGQHGYRVHAASAKPHALGCESVFASHAHLSPSYQSADYLPWLRELIVNHQIQSIVPSEGFLLAIKDHFFEFCHLMAIPQDPVIVYGCLSKVYVFDQFFKSADERLRQHISKTAIICNSAELDALDFQDWQLPFFIKGDGFYSLNGDNALVAKAESAASARKMILQALDQFKKVLVQDCSSGVKATVNLLYQDGKLLAESMVVATHENPHTGGLTSLRHSWWHQEMYEDAVRRVCALRWDGPAMVEYKWDEKLGKFDFIELNSRYWAALNLDILAGLHFPAIQMDNFFHYTQPTSTQRLRQNITVRHAFPADFGYLLSKIRDPSVATKSKFLSLLGFFAYFLHPGIKSDLNYPGDRKLAIINTKAFLSELLQACKKKLN